MLTAPNTVSPTPEGHDAYDTVGVFIDANCPVLLVVTHEEDRVTRELVTLVNYLDDESGAVDQKTVIRTYSLSQGLRTLSTLGDVPVPPAASKKGKTSGSDKTLNPPQALGLIAEEARKETIVDPATGQPAPRVRRVWILYDLLNFMAPGVPGYATSRALRDAVAAITSAGAGHTIIIMDSQSEIAPRLEKVITRIDWPLPDRAQIRYQINALFPVMRTNIIADEGVEVWDEKVEKVTNASLGLTSTEVENLLALSMARCEDLDTSVILGGKKAIIKARGGLEFYETKTGLEGVGGAGVLKDWLIERQQCFSQKAKDFGLKYPKGLVLIGVSGCGKSHTAKAIASAFSMPCLRLDIGAIMGKFVGQSEERIRGALQLANSMSPCVVWCDEAEKNLATGGDDGGTTQRVIGTILTFMQENTAPVFFVFTMNSVKNVPPELLRKGRISEIFFMDIPNRSEREEIIRIHLKMRGRNPDSFDMEQLLDVTDRCTGAELETMVEDGLVAAFFEDRKLSTEDMVVCAQRGTKFADTMAEELANIREWASTRARRATAVEVDEGQLVSPERNRMGNTRTRRVGPTNKRPRRQRRQDT